MIILTKNVELCFAALKISVSFKCYLYSDLLKIHFNYCSFYIYNNFFFIKLCCSSVGLISKTTTVLQLHVLLLLCFMLLLFNSVNLFLLKFYVFF